jgi:polyhydroxybutyrate depolymerase
VSRAAPAPIIYFHGTADEVVPFGGGQPEGEDIDLPSVPTAMRDWARHNGCTADTVERIGKDVRLQEWTDCTADADVEYYRVRAAGTRGPGRPRSSPMPSSNPWGRPHRV